MSHRLIVILCGLFLSISAFSTDIILPAFQSIQDDLHLDAPVLQLTVSLYLLAYGCGQLIFGVFSDRFGRRPTLSVGLGLYIVGSIFAMQSTTIEWLLMARILQGFGGACGQVVARAILRDIYSGQALARAMATAMAIFAFGPMVGPFLGAGMVELADWRFIFIATGIFGMLLAIMLLPLPETLVQKNMDALRLQHIIHAIKSILLHGQSGFFVLVTGLGMFLMTSFITNAPFIFEKNYNIVGLEFALFFALAAVGIILGQFLNRYLLKYFVPQFVALVAVFLLFMIVIIAILLSWNAYFPFWLFVIFMMSFGAFFVTMMSNFASLVLDPHPQIAGMASSVFGFLPQTFAAMTASILNFYILGELNRWLLCVVIAIGCVLTLMLIRHLRYR